MELRGGRGQVVRKSSLAMDADDAQVGATVSLADTTGIALATSKKWIDNDACSRRRPNGVWRQPNNAAGNLMSADPRIGHVGVLAQIDVEIAGAKPRRADLDQRLAGSRLRLRSVDERQSKSGVEYCGLHLASFR
jgi:hypothetical protein